MQLANLIHGSVSLLLIAASFGHIYIGTAGTEGALEGMKSGHVDETWAKQHHDLWYHEVKNEGSDKQ
jgi:formate dehydrogenase subunit gamma